MSKSTRPNIIVVVTDDHGYGDLGCFGSDDLKTPHLDRLAASGAVLTECYSNSPVCSPSRAAILRGQHPARTGVDDVLGGHRTEEGLTGSHPTIASELKSLGYRTSMIGKWHLGVAPGSRPSDHGFDEWFGTLSGGIDYFSHINYNLWPWDVSYHPVHDLWDNGLEVWRNGDYVTEVIAERAVEFIDRVTPTDDPFFLYVGFTAPHSPMHAPAEYIDRFSGLTPARRIMAAMLAAMDDGVGSMVEALDRAGELENTLFFMMSDNGPSRHPANWLDGNQEPYYGASAGELRGGKTSLFEGGIRSPSVLHWPDRVRAGQVVSSPVLGIDLLPSLVAAAGGSTEGLDLDGVDLIPTLTGKSPPPERDLFWSFRHQTAMRRGQWKVVLEPYESDDNPAAELEYLFDLEADPSESRNLKSTHPELFAELKAVALSWRAGLEIVQ